MEQSSSTVTKEKKTTDDEKTNKRKSDNEPSQSVSKVFRSETSSLPFSIANVLQVASQPTKVPPAPVTTGSMSSSSLNPWLMALNHLSQSSTTIALANASNWCAKCSTQFRLTSELVHHIRIQHATRRNHYYHSTSSPTTTRKTMTTSATTLICPICCETFRERHHLTRHMTSHR